MGSLWVVLNQPKIESGTNQTSGLMSLLQQLCHHKPITMTNTYIIAGTAGGLMVLVLYNTGSGMAWILYTDSTGIL